MLLQLPKEIITHILSFIGDTTYISMTNKKLSGILFDMYDKGNMKNINDSY
jgi:hypothetical protein